MKYSKIMLGLLVLFSGSIFSGSESEETKEKKSKVGNWGDTVRRIRREDKCMFAWGLAYLIVAEIVAHLGEYSQTSSG